MTAVVVLLISLIVSILVEWVGMHYFWPEEGIQHSINMAKTELQYLNDDFKRSLLVESPKNYAINLTNTVHEYVFVKTGIQDSLQRGVASNTISNQIAAEYFRVAAYHALSAMYVTQVFLIRLSILTLSIPAFFIVGVIAAVEGLVHREIRKWEIGRERAAVYHYAKRGAGFFFIAPWVIYLAIPTSIHPNLVILPFVALFSLGIFFMTSLFKKYI